MLKVAITGNIASGKSTVEEFIKNRGYIVYDADKIAHEILKSNEDVRKTFGTTDRKELSKIVFSNPDKLRILESIIHPLVKEKIEEIFSLDFSVVFISIPQLFETGFDSMFDRIIFVSANKSIRLSRLMERNNLSKEEAIIRINAQENEVQKIEKSDFVIVNNGDLKKLEAKTIEIIDQILI